MCMSSTRARVAYSESRSSTKTKRTRPIQGRFVELISVEVIVFESQEPRFARGDENDCELCGRRRRNGSRRALRGHTRRHSTRR